MQVSVSDAKGKLTELVRRAEAGDEVVLTRHGQPSVRLVPVATKPSRAAKAKRVESKAKRGAVKQGRGRVEVD